MQVPFVDLHATTDQVKDAYLKELTAFLDRANFILTPEVEEFETAWARYVGAAHCIGVSSGADALYLSLLALDIGAGDEIIIQGNAYNACVTAILRTGAIPVFVDIEPETYTIALDRIETAITPKTKAIMPVHLYGQMCDMEKLMAIAKAHDLKVIEDCAQAHGATFKGKQAGSWGDIAAFSFYPTKNLGAFGDAGAILTNDDGVRDHLRALRNLGQTRKNDHQYLGTNMRLDPLQAVALSLKLSYFSKELSARQAAGAYYRDHIEALQLPLRPIGLVPNAEHAYHLFVVELREDDRNKLQERLSQFGVGTAVHYPIPVYRQPFYTGLQPLCPVADAVASRILSLPLFYGITEEQQAHVIHSLEQSFESL